MSRREEFQERAASQFDPVDPRPHELCQRVPREPSLKEQIRQLVRVQLSEAFAAQGYGTFEEEDDFEVDDEYDLASPHEDRYRMLKPEDGQVADEVNGTDDVPSAAVSPAGG